MLALSVCNQIKGLKTVRTWVSSVLLCASVSLSKRDCQINLQLINDITREKKRERVCLSKSNGSLKYFKVLDFDFCSI